MLKKFCYKNITWIDLESSTEEELSELGTTFNIHPVVLSELNKPSARAKVDLYNDFIYLILHFPSKEKTQEIDFVVGKDFIITTHYEMINPLNDFAKIFETDFILKKNQEKLHSGFIFFYIMRELYDYLENDLSLINDKLKEVEGKVFSGQERQVVKQLSEINRDLLDCRWTLKSHKEVLASMELAGEDMFGTKFSYYLKSISGAYERIWNTIENSRATFLDLRDTNDSLLSIKTNETMRLLTVTAFILLPMTIVGQMFGISSVNIPIVRSPNAFFIVISLMLIASFVAYIAARLKKWI